MTYKHGIYTENIATAGNPAVKATGTIPVYIGTAPIHTTASTDNKVNVPILINSYTDFVEKMGESDDWGKYTLCEVAYVHFKNNIQAIAPFVVINMFDPSTQMDADGEDIDLTKITKAEFTKAVNAIDATTIKCGVTPNILVAPYFSETKDYADLLVNKCTSLIGGKWGCVAYIDISTSNATIDAAIAGKTALGINSKFARLHYPKAKHGNKVLHLSVIDAVITQFTDNNTDGVACRSSSNKAIPCDVPVINADTEVIYSEADANKLNEKGITTINYIGGGYRLWGGQMANYDYSSINSIDSKDRSDATVRMQIYIDSWLKREHVEAIDAPLTRREIDSLLSRINIGLNSLVNSGYLLKGECYFDTSDNAIAELADGNLVLDVLHTEVPNGKSISFKLRYDLEGLTKLYSEEEV